MVISDEMGQRVFTLQTFICLTEMNPNKKDQKNGVNMQQHINNCGKYHSNQYRIWTDADPLLRVSASPYNQLFEQNEQIGRGYWIGRSTSMDILVNELSMSVTICKIPHWVTVNGCTYKRTFQNTGEQLSLWTTANTKEHWLLGKWKHFKVVQCKIDFSTSSNECVCVTVSAHFSLYFCHTVKIYKWKKV